MWGAFVVGLALGAAVLNPLAAWLRRQMDRLPTLAPPDEDEPWTPVVRPASHAGQLCYTGRQLSMREEGTWMRRRLSRLEQFIPHAIAVLLVATCVQMLWRGWVLAAGLVFVMGAVAGILVYLPRGRS